MQVLVDGQQIGSDVQVESPRDVWKDYSFQTKVPDGSQKISVVFTEDYWGPDGDRNLYIDTVSLNGRQLDHQSGGDVAYEKCLVLYAAGAIDFAI
jgi:hypothetical protein